MINLLQTPVTMIKGIGEETALSLQTMGIMSVNDLLLYFPYRYEDNRLRDITEVKHEEKITVEGKVHGEPSLMYYARKKNRLTFRFFVGPILVKAVCFNRPYYKDKLHINQTITITGKWDQHRQTITVQHIHFGPFNQENEVEPVYSVKGNVSIKQMRKFIANAISTYSDEMVDYIPERLSRSYKLPAKVEAVKILHFPQTHEQLKNARRYFVYEEFLMFQLKIQALRKYTRENSKGIEHQLDYVKIKEFISSLPFPLTGAQNKVVQEIMSDISSPYRMNRLLQGDVGSGKTVVAAIALFAILQSGYQGALMVPTEILAEQHAESLSKLFEQVSVRVELLTSSVKGKKRKQLLEELSNGEIGILVGTHALIQDEVQFHKLGLVITDEQHRFGVQQRRILREKGESPDVLFMTATPIPRTLAITAFGEMDVSIINEMPAGRKVIETYTANHHMIDRVLTFVEKELLKGRQAYIICPLIEESEKIDVQNAIDVHVMLSDYYRGKWNIGLMHGRLSSDEKEEVMKQFSKNEVQVLVSTTVVEVGVNVPNATIMVIYDAERFGLSQLHQLRGRVGRGTEQSYCILLADPKTEEGKERMRIMTETNDGFVLSEKDLELRGPGDFFGKKQSGVPEFKVADMVHDYRALEVARQDAYEMLHSEEFWSNEEYIALRNYINDTGVLDGEKLD